MPFETDQKSGCGTGIFSGTRQKLAEFGGPVIVRHAALSVCFFTLYLLLNRSDILMETQLGFTLWYPATGLGLALMLGVSPWYVLLVCLAGVASDALIYHQPLASWSESIVSAGPAAIYAGAAIALRGSLRIDTGLNHRRDVVRYVFVTLTAAVLATMVGVRCLVADHSIAWNQFWRAAFSWFSGDSIALVVVTPFLLIHVLPWLRRGLSAAPPAKSVSRAVSSEKTMPRRTLGTIAEAVGQGTIILVLLWVMFGHPQGQLQLFYLSFIPVIWIAMRHGIKRVVTGLLVLNFGIVIALRIFPQEPAVLPEIGMLMLVVSFTGLLVGAAVSERHRMARELRGQTEYLNSLIENTPLGIVVLLKDGRVERCNDAFERLFQFDRKQLIGNDLDSLISPIDASLRGSQFRAQLASGRPVHASTRFLRKDGTRIDVELNAVSLLQAGEVRGAYTIYKDISDQVQAG